MNWAIVLKDCWGKTYVFAPFDYENQGIAYAERQLRHLGSYEVVQIREMTR